MESAIIIAAQGGDRKAFGSLVSLYSRRIYNVAYSFLRNTDDAADVAQETFMKAFLAIERFKADRPVFPWLYQIARNLSLNRIEKRNRETTAEADFDLVPAAGFGPSEALDREERTQAVRRAMRRLSPSHREILVLKEFDGCGYAEIAEILDNPIGTVMSRLYHARMHLKTILAASGGEEGRSMTDEYPLRKGMEEDRG
jgi:RNA polymerase sigma-70 factor (ECF subfamily)